MVSLFEGEKPAKIRNSTWFVPATIEAKDLFSMSQVLLKVTICNLPESFEEVSLTHHELACRMLLCSLCF
ncbi:hypothetical protein ARALYDRAFT_894341 [Arabidopsis lyrata subsp. lyrata]|uniref:Uncharacterized protein n=1 Tax=Arabidopsis lyrata subsp. lyrata TaxID=81972 RepID=D7KUA2_ARALL|nr:hypothetical protein ARALYDRAFT_894341 [Arabidopsis lyrata subsp. lyrata]